MELNKDYYYFSTHTIKYSIYNRLTAGREYEDFNEETKLLIDKLVDSYPRPGSGSVLKESPVDFCSKFINSNKDSLSELIEKKGFEAKFYLTNYLGYVFRWGSSTTSFGKNSDKRAEKITEEELINEMISPNGTIKKLLDCAGGNLTNVKPFLPAIMTSLDTNTRNRSFMEFKHSGRFCFDFDKLEGKSEARKWMEKLWEGTTNIKPFKAFISPRGKGFKLFCRVDISNEDFKRDFGLQDREPVMKHHKVWYEGAKREILKKFPELVNNFDDATNDAQRLAYLPYISDPKLDFKYDASRVSNYSEIVDEEKKRERKILLKKISENSSAIKKIMDEQGITSKEDAYHLLLKSRKKSFDVELETEKFVKLVDFIEELSSKDDRVSEWVYSKFNDYHILHKMSWVLYGVFGDLAIEQIKRLIPPGSNKLDESHNDYRWAVRSKDDYDQDQLANLTPGAFYSLVMELGEVKDFISENFRVSSKDVSDMKLLNNYYETYSKNILLLEEEDESADESEFLDQVTDYVDKKKIRLPLIQELDEMTSEVVLGPTDYLNKDVMTELYQNKYSEKRIFSLRSQCGTGKNSVAGNPLYKLKGRVILAEPFRSISDQAASEAWINGDRQDQLFVNSGVEETLKSFKTKDTETIKVNYETTLRNATLPESPELVVHCTYNQVINLSFDELEKIDYLFIDECHTLSDGLNYRASVIAGLIYHLVEFVAKRRSSKTKIIFMSGTPNVETHVIPELMEEYNIRNLFQRIIVDKSYKVRPTIHLTHLDTDNYTKRQDTVISQMNKYLKQGRKVCHIFNHKGKMDEYVREIQSKLSSDIKVGLFYSDSTGECTRNILAGKFGEYDVVLATTYFINGINIEKDGITNEEFKSGKSSSQKYGVVIDLGRNHTRVNAMDAIQAINRFRNRLCHSTILLPKIFKPDLKNPSRKFNFSNAAKVLLGINKYNYHLLSVNDNLDPFQMEEEEIRDKIFLLDSLRKNPIYVSMKDINQATKDEENRTKISNMITRKFRLYEDWFCSLDGYHYLAKDAGFLSIIKHKNVEEDLEEMTEDQIDLENKLVKNFLTSPEILDYLEDQIDPSKRIIIRASDAVSDPLSTSISNLRVVDLLNEKYVVKADFHYSHERVVNKLIKAHLKLLHWYGKEDTMDLVKLILDKKCKFYGVKAKLYSSKILEYVKSCSMSTPKSYINTYSYIKGLDLLSEIPDLEITKDVRDISFEVITDNPDIAKDIKYGWAEAQYQSLVYKIEASESGEKEDLLEYYSDKKTIRDQDLESLNISLAKFGIYKPVKITKKFETPSGRERFKINKILRSKNLLKSNLSVEAKEFVEPEKVTLKDFKDSLKEKEDKYSKVLKKSLNGLKTALGGSYQVYSKEIDEISDTEGLILKDKIPILEKIRDNSSLPGIFKFSMIDLISESKDYSKVIVSAFKASEYILFRDLKVFSRLKSLDEYLLTPEEFKVSDLLEDPEEPNYVDVSKYKELVIEKLKETLSRPRPGNYLVALKDEKLICVSKSKVSFSRELCTYAFNNEGFILESGPTTKTLNKGIYNYNTFVRDYVNSPIKDRRILNYVISHLEITKEDLSS